MIGFDRNVMVVVTLGLRRVGRALPGLVLALALGIAVVLLAAPVAFAYDRPTDLRRVASIFAMRDAEVRCPSSAEWIADPIWGTGPNPSRAWGSTDMIEEYIVLHPALCAGALGVSDALLPLWQRATGVLVLLHEAYHVRHWKWRRNEGKSSARRSAISRSGRNCSVPPPRSRTSCFRLRLPHMRAW